MMHRLRHCRVVKLLGVIMEEGSYSLVMEYMEQGDLMRVLKAQVRLARPPAPVPQTPVRMAGGLDFLKHNNTE